jgi:hypothetical protein
MPDLFTDIKGHIKLRLYKIVLKYGGTLAAAPLFSPRAAVCNVRVYPEVGERSPEP